MEECRKSERMTFNLIIVNDHSKRYTYSVSDLEQRNMNEETVNGGSS